MVKLRSDFKDRTGENYITNEGYEVTIIEYFNVDNCSVIFKNGYVSKNVPHSSVKNGQIKNPLHPSVYGIGYIGIGKYKSKINGKSTKEYSTWHNILTRCYDESYKVKKPTYNGCIIDVEWLNFQVFAEWLNYNYDVNNISDWHLDKDILKKGNKIYSPETCCLVPIQINSLLIKSNSIRGEYPIGVSKRGNRYRAVIKKFGKIQNLGTFDTIEEAFQAYKVEKELYIKDVAKIWKPRIKEKIYNALINYKVEITD